MAGMVGLKQIEQSDILIPTPGGFTTITNDIEIVRADISVSSVGLTLPSASSYGTRRTLTILVKDAQDGSSTAHQNFCWIAAAGSDSMMRGTATATDISTFAKGDVVRFRSDGTSVWYELGRAGNFDDVKTYRSMTFADSGTVLKRGDQFIDVDASGGSIILIMPRTIQFQERGRMVWFNIRGIGGGSNTVTIRTPTAVTIETVTRDGSLALIDITGGSGDQWRSFFLSMDAIDHASNHENGGDQEIDLAGLTATSSTFHTAGASGSGADAITFSKDTDLDGGLKLASYENAISPSAIQTALSLSIPAGAVLFSVQTRVTSALTGGGTTTNYAIGSAVDPDKYTGTVGGLTSGSTTDDIPTWTPGASVEPLYLNAVDSGGNLGDTALTVGTVRVKIMYWKLTSLTTS